MIEPAKRKFIYIAVREEESRLVKIGYSCNPMRRMGELSGTGAAFPFHLLHAWELAGDAYSAEDLIHNALDWVRVNPNREFFDVFDAYPSLVNLDFPDSINCLHICNRLAGDIEALFVKKEIVWRRIYYNELAEYYFATHGKIVY